MKISIFTTITDPETRQDAYLEALECYLDFADEVIVVNGGESFKLFKKGFQYHKNWEDKTEVSNVISIAKIKEVKYEWPEEFDWKFIGQQFQRGYDACTGDWAIRMDIDYLLHEDDFDYIREFLLSCETPVACFVKRQFLKADRYNVKAILPIAFNKEKYGNRIKLDSGGDLCQPSLDGKEIDKEKMPIIAKKVPVVIHGNITEEQKKKRLGGAFIENGITYTYGEFIPIWNYEYLIRTEPVAKEQLGRFARAWTRTFKNKHLGGPDGESALECFNQMIMGRYKSSGQRIIKIEEHPKYIREIIKNLSPNQHGYNFWGKLND